MGRSGDHRIAAMLVGMLSVAGCGSSNNQGGGGGAGLGGTGAGSGGAGAAGHLDGGSSDAGMGGAGGATVGGAGASAPGGTAGAGGGAQGGVAGAGGAAGGSPGSGGGGGSSACAAGAPCAGTMSGPWCVEQFFQSDLTARINALWSDGPTDVWAVGSRGTSSGGVAASEGFILHWDGCAWTQSSFTVAAGLNDVWGASANDVWAVGDLGKAVHWDGGAWSSVQTGTNGGFAAVSGSSGGDVWAVGLTGAFHWNGTAWTVSPGFPNSTQLLTAFTGDIWAVAPNDVWIAMSWTIAGSVAHFDGTRWTITEVAVPGFTLNGIWSDGSTAWAVGEGSQIFKRSAGGWTEVQTPSGSSVGYDNVMARGNDTYAVGIGVAHASGGGAFREDNDVPVGTYHGLWMTTSQVWIAGLFYGNTSPSSDKVIIIHRAR
jgi:hypothetical protein